MAVPGEKRDNIAELDVEVVEGNVVSTDDAVRVVDGCDTVFHAAAIYQDWAPDPTVMYDVNMRGTFNMLEAARRGGVERVVYTASIASIGRPDPDSLADEQTPYEAWDIDFPYSRSKLFSRELAEYFSDWGLDVRVVCPGLVLGPGDIRPTPSGRLILTTAAGGPAIYFDGGANYVDVRDAAHVHVLAAQRGEAGHRYLATAHNLTNLEFRSAIDHVVGRKRRFIKLPVGVARTIVRAMNARATRTGKRPMLALPFFEYGVKNNFYTNENTIAQLGATFRPIEETITDALAYFRQQGKMK